MFKNSKQECLKQRQKLLVLKLMNQMLTFVFKGDFHSASVWNDYIFRTLDDVLSGETDLKSLEKQIDAKAKEVENA